MYSIVKILVVLLLSVFSSYLSDRFSEPPVSEGTKDYQQYYETKRDQILTVEELEELRKKSESFVEQLNSPGSADFDVQFIVGRKLVFVSLFGLMWLLIGLKLNFDKKLEIILAMALLFLSASFFVPYVESALYATVLGGGYAWRQNKKGKKE